MVILINSNWVRVVGVEFGLCLLLKSSPCDGLESLFDVDGLLCAGLKVRDVSLGLAPSHGSLLRDHPLALLYVDLVAEDDKGEVFGIVRGGLDEEFVTPRVERLEGFGIVDVVAETTAVGTSVESDAERLETFLSSSVPELHGNETVIDHDFAREEVGTDGGFVG